MIICTKFNENSISFNILTFYKNKLLLHFGCWLALHKKYNNKHFY